MFQTWIDGVGFSPDTFFPQGHNGNGTGALMGYDPQSGNIMERQRVHSGKQSAPFDYGYQGRATSEVDRTFNPPDDWSRHGVQSLCLYFSGSSDNKAARLYVRINNGPKLYYQGAQDDLKQTGWMAFPIDLATAGANLQSVSKLTIGVEGAGAAGRLLIDDIGLYPKAVELITPVPPAVIMARW